MHTVNNLLQTLNYVKRTQYSVVKQKFNIIHIMCENFRTKPKYSLFNLKGSKSIVTIIVKLDSTLHFGATYIFICHTEQ